MIERDLIKGCSLHLQSNEFFADILSIFKSISSPTVKTEETSSPIDSLFASTLSLPNCLFLGLSRRNPFSVSAPGCLFATPHQVLQDACRQHHPLRHTHHLRYRCTSLCLPLSTLPHWISTVHLFLSLNGLCFSFELKWFLLFLDLFNQTICSFPFSLLSLEENGMNRFCISHFCLDVPSAIPKIYQNCFQLKDSGIGRMTHQEGNRETGENVTRWIALSLKSKLYFIKSISLFVVFNLQIVAWNFSSFCRRNIFSVGYAFN
jgi:hypothetical protein